MVVLSHQVNEEMTNVICGLGGAVQISILSPGEKVAIHRRKKGKFLVFLAAIVT
jgi:hypothetical protein